MDTVTFKWTPVLARLVNETAGQEEARSGCATGPAKSPARGRF